MRFLAVAAAFLIGVALASDSTSSSSNAVIEQDVERSILVSLYQYTNGDSWTKRDRWNDTEMHYCDWYGVQCITPEASSRRHRRLDDVEEIRSVESIDLAENNLRGSVPISLLLLLPNIRSIRINGNNVDYSQVEQQEQEVLGQVLNLPISVHSAIQHLDISHTSVKDLARIFRTGSGDTVILTPRLKIFFASQSEIRGPFPEYLMEVTTLERLGLDHNALTGTLPLTLGNLHSLKYLSLADNQLTGSLPATIDELGKLLYLMLESNRLTGTIPLGLASSEYTPLLEQLDLSNQRDESTPPGPTAGLSGSVPAFSTQKRLRRVDLGVNSFTGPLSSSLLRATDINDFDFVILSSNLITGSVPSSILSRIPSDALFLDDNLISDLSSCPFSEYGCSAILCPPGTYEPRAGRQEEDRRPCLDCPQNTQYWGQRHCRLQENIPTSPPSPEPTRPPGSAPTTGPPTDVPFPTRAPTSSPTEELPSDPVNEKAVLLDLYTAAGGADWFKKDGWSSPNDDASFCEWYGIVCDINGSVRFLNLDGNNLTGEFSESLYTLPNLRALDLSHNDGLTITFRDIGKSRSLEALDVSKTIIATLDGLLDAASRLQELHLNDVSGFEGQPFPSVLYQLTNLRQLSLDYNAARGKLPSDLGKISKLVIFSASNNELSGTIPSSIADLTDLATLRLSTNHLSGTIPSAMTRMGGLSLLDLSNQWSNGVDDDFSNDGQPGLHGPLPSFDKLSQIRRLDLGVNSFTGTIPENFLAGVDPENLFEFADIGDNFLTGTVPSGVARLPNLYLHDNYIVGIDPTVCENVPLDLQGYGCDAVLCQSGTFNEIGRQVSDDKPCLPCTTAGGAKYFGSTECVIEVPSDQPSSPPSTPTLPPAGQPTDGGNVSDTPQRVALELIYTECNGPGWAARNNWMDKAVSICFWDGIRCDASGKVVDITLRSNLLDGTFPSLEVFENIPSLTTLVLDGNSVKFTFEGIDSATNLDTLDLTNTELTSAVGVEKAPALKNLYIASNNLKGTLPTELFSLASLSRLAIAFNDFTGQLPDDISKWSSLEFLSFHDNEFSGSIPTTIGTMSNLVFLLLQFNNLSGTIPTQMNLLSNLGFVALNAQRGNGGKGLTGGVPSFANITNLKKLDLSMNELTGIVPSDFLSATSVPSFEHLTLAHNQLTGQLPNILSRFPADQYDFTDNEITTLGDELCNNDLGGVVEAYGCDAVLCSAGTWNDKGRQLDVGDTCESCPENPFLGAIQCGEISPSPTNPPIVESDLTDVAILGKVFDGTRGSWWHRKDHWKQSDMSVCEWFGVRCDKEGNNRIEHIVLSANNLVGTIPKEIFELPYLKTLVVDTNNVNVDLSGIGAAQSLETLDLSATAVVDLVGIEFASQLRELHVKNNGMAGSFPTEIFQLTTLEQIIFDFNSFRGPLQHEIGKLTNLKQLSGERNELSGVLPDELRNLTNLVTLRLGKNSFEGNIPASALDEMTSLSYIDLSHQDEHGGKGLSGDLPPLPSLRRLAQIRLKSNAFSGTVPFNFLKNVNHDEFEYADLSSNRLTGTLPASVARVGAIYIEDNMITGVPSAFCDASRGVAYAQYGCDAFLCSPGFYNLQGHQESADTICADCPQAKFFGSISCGRSPTSSPINDAVPKVNERDVLKKLYHACGGDKWDEAENWMDDGKSFCTWTGITCVGVGGDSVESINLASNNLQGTPPTEIYALPNLKSLSLYSNPFRSIRFDGIQFATKMTELLLDATGLSSVQGIEKAPSLELLNLRFNSLQGSIPSELTNLSTLHTLTMAYNALTGPIPTGFEEMTKLEALLLSHNELSGNLHSVNFPSSIRRLDLSDNKITGSIPLSFLTMVPFDADLEIDLSSNLLTGSIPTDLARFTSLNIYLKDNLITKIDDELCQMSDWNEGDVGRYGCNGILCPKGHFSANGRHSSAGQCQECAQGRYLHLGSSDCKVKSSSNSVDTLAVVLSAGGMLLLNLLIA